MTFIATNGCCGRPAARCPLWSRPGPASFKWPPRGARTRGAASLNAGFRLMPFHDFLRQHDLVQVQRVHLSPATSDAPVWFGGAQEVSNLSRNRSCPALICLHGADKDICPTRTTSHHTGLVTFGQLPAILPKKQTRHEPSCANAMAKMTVSLPSQHAVPQIQMPPDGAI